VSVAVVLVSFIIEEWEMKKLIYIRKNAAEMNRYILIGLI
jgi:hypothetical protein